MMKNEWEEVESSSLSEDFEEINLEESVKDFSTLFNEVSKWYYKTIKEDMINGNSKIIRTSSIEKLIKNYKVITSKYREEEIINFLNNSLVNESIPVGKYGGEEINSTLSEEIFTASATFARYIINKIELDKYTKNKDLITKHLEVLYPFLDSKTRGECKKFLGKKLESGFDKFEKELKDLDSVTKDFEFLCDELERLYYDELMKSNSWNRDENRYEVITKIEETYERHLEKYPKELDEYSISNSLKRGINNNSFAIYRLLTDESKRNYQNYDYCLALSENFLHENLKKLGINYNQQDRLARLQKEIKSLRNQLESTKREIESQQSWTVKWFNKASEQTLSGLKRKAQSLEIKIKELESQLSSRLEVKIQVPLSIK